MLSRMISRWYFMHISALTCGFPLVGRGSPKQPLRARLAWVLSHKGCAHQAASETARSSSSPGGPPPSSPLGRQVRAPSRGTREPHLMPKLSFGPSVIKTIVAHGDPNRAAKTREANVTAFGVVDRVQSPSWGSFRAGQDETQANSRAKSGERGEKI